MSRYSDLILSDSPSAYWRLGNASGPTVTATVGNNLTATNSPTFGVAGLLTDDPDTAMSFVGASSQDATGSDSGLPTGNGAWTVECWVKTTSANEDGLVLWGTAGSSRDVCIGILSGAVIFDTSTFFNSFGGTVNNDKSHHVAVTWNGTTMLAYVDGSQVGTGYAPGALNITLAGAAGVLLGRRSALFYDGTLDEVAIYAATLTPTQVKTHWIVGSTAVSSYRPVIASNNRVGPMSLRRRARHVIYASEPSGAAPQNLQLTAADAITITDSVVQNIAHVRTASDSIATTDSVARQLGLNRTASDALTVGDSVSRAGSTFLRTAADSVTIAESVAALKVTPRTASDSITVADSVARQVTNLRTAADSVTVADSVSRTVTNNRTAADGVTITDAVTGAKVNLRTASDSIATTDSVARILTLGRTVADSVSVGNTVARILSLFRTASDSVTISESVTGSVSHGVVARTADDALTVSDAATRQVTNLRTAADGLTISESVAQQTTSFGTLADSVTVGNAATRQLTLFRTAADSVTISDSATATVNGTPIVPTGGAHKGPTFIGRLPERQRRRREERIRVPADFSVEVRDAVRFRTSVSAVVEFNDDEDAIELLVLAGAL